MRKSKYSKEFRESDNEELKHLRCENKKSFSIRYIQKNILIFCFFFNKITFKYKFLDWIFYRFTKIITL